MDEDDLIFVDAVLFDDEQQHHHHEHSGGDNPHPPRGAPPPEAVAAAGGGRSPSRSGGSGSRRPFRPSLIPPDPLLLPPPEDDGDPAGSIVARALDAGRVPEFRGRGVGAGRRTPAGAAAPPGSEDGGGMGGRRRKFRPLLCSENLRFAWASARWTCATLVRRGPRHLAAEVAERLWALLPRGGAGLGRRRPPPTWRDTASSTAALVLISLLLLAAPSYACAVMALRLAALCALAVMTLLVDPEEVASACPGFVRALGALSWAAWRAAEGRVLLRHAYEGRDWGYVDPASAAGVGDAERRRHQGLLRRWRGRFGKRMGGRRGLGGADRQALFESLERERAKTARFGPDTAEHVKALSFCYAMLRGVKEEGRGDGKPRGRAKHAGRRRAPKAKRGELSTVASHSDGEEEADIKISLSGGRGGAELKMPGPGLGSGHLRQRSSSWPRLEAPGPSESDKEAVEVVLDREKKLPNEDREEDLVLNVSSLVECDEEEVERIEIVGSKGHKKKKRRQREGRHTTHGNEENGVHGLSYHRRINSDSNLAYSSQDKDDSTVHTPRTSLFGLGLSFDDLSVSDNTSSILSSSTQTESQFRASRNCSMGSKDATREKELNWLDVGTKIGIRLLNSEKVQKAINNPSEAENFLGGLRKGKKSQTPKKADKGSPSKPPRESAPEPGGSPHTPDARPTAGAGGGAFTPLRRTVCIEERGEHGQISPLGMEGDAGRAHSPEGSDALVPRPVHAIWTSAGAPACPDSPTPTSSCASGNDADGPNFDEDKTEGGGVIDVASADIASADSPGSGPLRGQEEARTPEMPWEPVENERDRRDGGTGSLGLRPLDSRRLLPPSMALRGRSSFDSPGGRPMLPALDGTPPKPRGGGGGARDRSPIRGRPFRPADGGGSPPPRAPPRHRASPATPGRPSSLRAAKAGTSSPPQLRRRKAISPGVKMVVPVCPIMGRKTRRIAHLSGGCHYQMATVVSSRRIYVPTTSHSSRLLHPYISLDESLSLHSSKSMEEQEIMIQTRSNCLSITVLLDKSFLRDGKFAEMTLRVMDEWVGRQYMPRHSKFPIGSCVATSFGIGVLVGWRVEDDCHVIRSLWRRRGAGSALAYLNRDALHGVVEAAVGFEVETRLGQGAVEGYVDGGPDNRRGSYFVRIREHGPSEGHLVQFARSDVLSCRAAKFIPVIEQIKESAKYQIQIENYELMLRERSLENHGGLVGDAAIWHEWSEGIELIMSSFIRSVEEDLDVNTWLSSVIRFLESLDFNGSLIQKKNELNVPDTCPPNIQGDVDRTSTSVSFSDENEETNAPSLWFIDDLFGGIFKGGRGDVDTMSDISSVTTDLSVRSLSKVFPEQRSNDSYNTAYSFLRTILRTVSIARASVPDRPNLQMGLSMCHEVILFVRTVIKVQQKNMSPKSVKAWKRTFDDIVATFGPLKKRLEKLGSGIVERLQEHGKIAKLRLLRFVDIIMLDDLFLQSLELGNWDQCIARIEIAVVKAGIIDRKTCAQYHKTAAFVYSTLAPRANANQDAAARNGEKFAQFAMALKWMASPQRSFLALFTRDDVLEVIERLMVRVYEKDSDACDMLNICAFNFHSFRHLRIFNNVAISGKLWKPILDAADEEFAWAVSRMPDNAREYVEPISKLFSLGVAKFHRIKANDLTSDWLDFLMEDDAIKIIQQLDLKLILNLEAFCNDLKEAMVVLPYYSSIDDDILNLIDEVELDKVLKEAAEALVDADRFTNYVREKTAVAVRRFLDYLPKMSIPVEKRELGEGWVLTCRDKHGGDLRLSDVCIEREYMTCNVIGSGNVFSPADILGDGLVSLKASLDLSPSMSSGTFDLDETDVELSVLNEIADLIRNAQYHGSWQPGIGGVQKNANGRSLDPAFEGLPVSEVLKCGVELWKNLEIDDEELMEIAIRDVSYQIQLQKEREEGTECVLGGEKRMLDERENMPPHNTIVGPMPYVVHDDKHSSHHDARNKRRFNPRKDPTVLFLEMNKVTCHLDEFLFRVEQRESSTIFDPVFEGLGSLTIKNLSIKLRVECRKERIYKLGTEVAVPVLQLQELEIRLERVKVRFKDTGADWLLNKIMKGFRDNITEIVEVNVKEQIEQQIQVALENLNSYIEVNPDLMLTILGITIDDLEENVIWV